MTGDTLFLFLVDDSPAHAFGKAVTLQTLHRDVSLVFFIVIDLLTGGDAIEAIHSGPDLGIRIIAWDNTRFIHVNLPLVSI